MLQSAYSRASRTLSLWNLVSSQSFPHLCKNLWKMALFVVLIAKCALFMATFWRRKPAEHDLRPFPAYFESPDPHRSPACKAKARETAMIASNIWEEILSRVQAKVNRHSFYTWFKPTAFVADDGRTVTCASRTRSLKIGLPSITPE